MSTPNWTQILDQIWAWPIDYAGELSALLSGNNVVTGSNPAYYLTDFYTFFPKFGGTPTTPTGDTTTGSADIANVSSVTGLAVGNPVAGAGIPGGATITAINGTVVTISAAATATATGITLTIYNAPPVPIAIQAAYLSLANASLVQARWQDMWNFAMALYIAHFLTLWARTDSDTSSTAEQIAGQGLTFGILISKAVGSVSASFKPISEGFEEFGAFNLTVYGQQFITFAKSIGAGPMLLW